MKTQEHGHGRLYGLSTAEHDATSPEKRIAYVKRVLIYLYRPAQASPTKLLCSINFLSLILSVF